MATTRSGRGRGDLPGHRRRIYEADACLDFDDLLPWAAAGCAGPPPVTWCIPAERFGPRAAAMLTWPDGRPIAGEADAWKLLAKAADSHFGKRDYSVHRRPAEGLGPRQGPDGTWIAVFRAGPKAEGRAVIAGRAGRGEPLSFNPAARPRPRPRGRYICRTSMGGCGHRHAERPETLCGDCQAAEAAASAGYEAAQARQAAERLARREWGQDWDDRANWQADHGQAAPRTPRETADRALSLLAGQHIDLETRQRRAAGVTYPWEETPPRPLGQSLARRASDRLQDLQQAADDQIRIARIPDPRLRELLRSWRADPAPAQQRGGWGGLAAAFRDR